MASVSLNEAREAHERLSRFVIFVEDFEKAIKFQQYHEEAKATFPVVIQRLKDERDAIAISLAKLKEEFQKEKASNERARFAQKTADDNQQKEIKAEVSTLLERKSELEKSHKARIEATVKEYEVLLREKKKAVSLEEDLLSRAKNDREEYKRKAASW